MPETTEPSDPGRSPASSDEEVLALGRQIADRLVVATPTLELTPWEQLQHEDFRQDMRLRRTYAKYVL